MTPETAFDPQYDYVEDPEEREAPVRATLTLVFELRSREPIELPVNQIAAWAADRLARVTDNGPYDIRHLLPDGSLYNREVGFGGIAWDWREAVEWLDDSDPPLGFHCGDCREPLVDEPCPRLVEFRGGRYPCIEGFGHHVPCRAAPWSSRPGVTVHGPA